MLRAIHIKEFGLFRDRTFALAGVTVFTGANQSGKSTLFDAVRIHAFGPDKRGKENRALYARYGDTIDVRLDWSDAPPAMDDPTFMNLFAVGGGQVEVDLSGDWLTGVKKRLFAGGIDPQALIAHFEKNASQKGSFAHMRARADQARRRDDCEERLAALEGQRQEVLAQMAGQATRQGEMKGLQANLAQLRGRERELSIDLGQEEQKAERRRLREILALLEQVGELEREQQARQPYAVDRTDELDVLERAAREAEAELIRAGEAKKREEAALEAARGELKRAAHEVDIRSRWREGARSVEERVSRYRDLKLSKRMIRGLAAVLLAALGVAAGVVSGWAGWGIGVLLGAWASAAAVAWGAELWEQRRMMAEVKDRWRAAAGGSATLDPAGLVIESRTLDGIVNALAKVVAEVERFEADLAARTERERECAERLRALEQALESAAGVKEERARAGRAWLVELGVDSRDAYVEALGEYRRARQRLADLDKQVESAQRERGCRDVAQLRSQTESNLAKLEEQADGMGPEGAGVDAQGLPGAELERMRENLAALRREIGLKEGELHELDRASHGQSERLMGRLGTLPEEIGTLLEDLRALNGSIAEIDRERLAAERALELLREVAADETSVLAELSAGVAETFSRLSGADGDVGGEAHSTAVSLAGLRADEIRAMDRQGSVRPVAYLSSGARHLLYLALRLEMARRERQGAFALLCLDEPFAYLDPERQFETLVYLRGFLEETGWQMLLFTNEPAQAERVQAVFPQCRVHPLDRGGE